MTHYLYTHLWQHQTEHTICCEGACYADYENARQGRDDFEAAWHAQGYCYLATYFEDCRSGELARIYID